jgi:RND family efflux transporter MFP subunit
VFDGEITFVHPHVEAMTRTAMVRVALSNTALHLRPGMYATVEIETELDGKTPLVPREAIIDTGTRQIAFVAREGGHFEPRKVTTGASGGDGVVQVLSGLAPGESVVASGQFLLDAESRMQEAIAKMLAEKETRSRESAPSAPDTRHPAPETRHTHD